jgi:Glycosyl transferase family 2
MDISLITSLYRSKKFLPSYINNINNVVKKLLKKNIRCEIILVSNQPDESEIEFLNRLKIISYIKVIIVDRESLYSSWNRGIREASGSVIGFWNVDDKRYWRAIEDGVKLIQKGEELIYFPYLFSGWFKINRIKFLQTFHIFMIFRRNALRR